MIDWVLNTPLSIALSLDRLVNRSFEQKNKMKFGDIQHTTYDVPKTSPDGPLTDILRASTKGHL